jgi:hypothetical protein
MSPTVGLNSVIVHQLPQMQLLTAKQKIQELAQNKTNLLLIFLPHSLFIFQGMYH